MVALADTGYGYIGVSAYAFGTKSNNNQSSSINSTPHSVDPSIYLNFIEIM